MMGTLKGFPYPPALWLRWAKPSSAYAFVMGSLEGWLGGLAGPLPMGRLQLTKVGSRGS